MNSTNNELLTNLIRVQNQVADHIARERNGREVYAVPPWERAED